MLSAPSSLRTAAQKLFGLWGGGGLSGTAAFFTQLGLTPAYPLAMLVGLVEFVGGLLLMAGAFTLISAAVLLFEMLVAVWRVHLAYGFFINWTNTPGLGHGFEFNLVLIGGLASADIDGPRGIVRRSLPRTVKRKQKPRGAPG